MALGLGEPLAGGTLEPVRRLFLIDLDAGAVAIGLSEVVLRRREAELGGPLKQRGGVDQVTLLRPRQGKLPGGLVERRRIIAVLRAAQAELLGHVIVERADPRPIVHGCLACMGGV
ncbi:MAG: hypothetical protein R3322_08685, partial [Kiloniellales bacterium]|nr:hypothetical protein [Kiloniellales bacterium]